MSDLCTGSPAERTIALYEELGNWRKVAEEISRRSGKKISAGMAHRVAGGYEPVDNEIRKAFGFPVIELIPQVRNPAGRFARKE
jgi:hypothetical protein